MTTRDPLEEQNKLLRAIVRLLVDREMEESTEADKARYLVDMGFTHAEVADLFNKSKSTISTQVSS